MTVPAALVIHLACTVSSVSGTATDDVTSVAVDCNSVLPQQKMIAGYFNMPWGVAVDASDNLLVADSVLGNVLQIPFSGGAYGTPSTLLSFSYAPWRSRWMPAGNLFITDRGRNTILQACQQWYLRGCGQRRTGARVCLWRRRR